jgi:methyl-accepting chemotaxis protein
VIKAYEKFEGTSNEEKELLKNLKDTFDVIMSDASDISLSGKSSFTGAEKIDNKNAINSIEKLSNTIYGVDTTWNEKSNNKINLLINFEKSLFDNLMFYVKDEINNFSNQIIYEIIFTIVLLLLVFLSIVFMTNRIFLSLKKFQINLNEFLAYSMKEKDNVNTHCKNKRT